MLNYTEIPMALSNQEKAVHNIISFQNAGEKLEDFHMRDIYAVVP